ncbi:uncharacterized protein LMH87_007581 [Akanthomyces muscarius]|uniref:Uncharacterized protein n=1 Tax=Akanthomyces muscarius TaxID=2231603 RepID=A0A9W8UPY4_AKAMU|nr:uncharacterized protein LMH87_007581 [Akanthomyces muscarius]KAJ4161547.1 hypothetical protein LMH87_007581 [Akanthomyces muscarius]
MVALNEEAAKDPAALGREVTTFLQEMQGAGVMENVEKFAQTIEASYVPRSKPGKRKLIETAMWHNDERRTTMPLAGEATAHDGMSSATLPAVNTMTMPAIGRQTKASGPFGAFLGLSPSKASLLFPAEMLAKIEVLEQRTGADDPLLDIGLEFQDAGGVRFMSSQNCRILPNPNLTLCGLNPEALKEHCCDDIFQACLPQEFEGSDALWPSASASFSIPASSHEADYFLGNHSKASVIADDYYNEDALRHDTFPRSYLNHLIMFLFSSLLLVNVQATVLEP